jgi:hypothetical protein
MTGREKIEAAFSPEGTPAFAAVTCYQGLCLRDHWEQATDAPWWALKDPVPEHQLQPWRDLLARTDEDWFPLRYGFSRKAREELFIETEGEAVWQVNRTSGARQELVREPVGGNQPGPEADHPSPAANVQDGDELDAVLEEVFGPPPEGPWPPDDGTLDLPHLMVSQLGDQHMPLAHVGTPWWHCHSLWNFTDLMMRAIEAPELVHHACARLLEFDLRTVQRAAAAGAEIIWIEDCMTDMISPAQCRDFSLAYLRPLVEAVRECGLRSVHYYCGRPDDRWDLLLDTGADALALEEGKKGFTVDLLEVAERVAGRMTLVGNLDAIGVLEQGSAAALGAEVARQCEAGRNNRHRFIASIGSPVTPGTSLARVRQFCDLVHEIGS